MQKLVILFDPPKDGGGSGSGDKGGQGSSSGSGGSGSGQGGSGSQDILGGHQDGDRWVDGGNGVGSANPKTA